MEFTEDEKFAILRTFDYLIMAKENLDVHGSLFLIRILKVFNITAEKATANSKSLELEQAAHKLIGMSKEKKIHTRNLFLEFAFINGKPNNNEVSILAPLLKMLE